ncbi:unnamed protein product [Polarella glacialis]|uniref:Transmembrane protein n=1 Tax=Polarella glacialis TaxID=89957 RepID=A0A813E6S4_POLGL|nr:unnamed protein product [Polarella glacialis]
MALRKGLPLSVTVGVLLLAFLCQAHGLGADQVSTAEALPTEGASVVHSRSLHNGDGDEPNSLDEDEDAYDQYKLLDAILRPLLILGSLVCIAVSTVGYWCLYIKPDPLTFTPARAVVPDDLKGRWKYGLFDCCGAPGTFCCFTFCMPCSVVDLWCRAGWIHAATSSSSAGQGSSSNGPFTGFQYFIGVAAYWIFQSIGNLCCMPVLFAFLRGGASFVDGSNGGMDFESHHERFAIPHFGFSTFCSDCCGWCWCGPCMGTQEYRQVMELLKRGPVQVQAPQMPMIVGMPVQVPMVTVAGTVVKR